ncbi:MAG: HD domain-containing protein [Patescibacteria group bacterium]
MMDEKFEKIKQLAMAELKDCSAHDLDHVLRVYNLALIIAENETGVDLEILQAAVLLHDIGGAQEANDPTGATDHAVVGQEMAKPILEKLNFSPDQIAHIQDCILSHRYRTDNKPKTIEAKILFDADKLDAIGAIGVARGYAWMGKNKAKIYKTVASLEEYAQDNLVGGKFNGRIKDRSKHSVQIQWELKEKHLLEKLYTATAKKIGAERIVYEEQFLVRLEKEIKGEI